MLPVDDVKVGSELLLEEVLVELGQVVLEAEVVGVEVDLHL